MTAEELAKQAKPIVGGIPAIEFESLVDINFWLTWLDIMNDIPTDKREAGHTIICGRTKKVLYMVGLEIAKDSSIVRGKGMVLFPMGYAQEIIAEGIVRIYRDYIRENMV